MDKTINENRTIKKQKKFIMSLAVIGLVLVISITTVWLIVKQKSIFNKKIDIFEVKDARMADALWKLGREHKVQYGFEGIPYKGKEWTKDKKTISLSLKNTTVRKVLNALVKADDRYFWQANGNFINIMPVAIKEDSSYLLNQRLNNFKIENNDREEAIMILNEQLKAEGKPRLGYFMVGIFSIKDLSKSIIDELPEEALSEFGGKEKLKTEIKTFTLHLRNVTIRETLNEIAKKEGDSCWSYPGSIDEHLLTFNKW